jgi:hypothetical protein
MSNYIIWDGSARTGTLRFLRMDYLQWKTQMRSEYFSHNVLARNINRWKNITADGLFRKNGTTTIWIWKHWNNLMVDNCSNRNSNWEIDDWMVRTEVKISMKKKYSACLYFKLLKSMCCLFFFFWPLCCLFFFDIWFWLPPFGIFKLFL